MIILRLGHNIASGKIEVAGRHFLFEAFNAVGVGSSAARRGGDFVDAAGEDFVLGFDGRFFGGAGFARGLFFLNGGIVSRRERGSG